MANIIYYPKDSKPRLVDEKWHFLPKDDLQLPVEGKILIPLSYWVKNNSIKDLQGKALLGELGICFSSDDDLSAHKESILAGLKIWSLIAIDFPVFKDGRGFSMAAILRSRYGWKGELRAVGDVLVDQLLQMSKVGFDTFALRSDQSVTVAMDQFQLYTHQLQNDWRSNRAQLNETKS